MKKDNFLTGRKGEEIAANFLGNKGYLIVERNFRTRFGEIDIVCLDGAILVFVEVKTKIGHVFGEPEEMVSKSKLVQVQRMGEIYIELKTQNFKNPARNAFNIADAGGSKNQSNVMPARLAARQDLIRHPENRLDSGSVPGMTSWKGGCRVDVVGIVLQENGDVETIRHHEAVY
ncbi:hypothetical protein A2572_00265 [Candidatus Collierbacteria bacterium RIFOXYD1_FULL_40_9]|uniref:UPF0102 protein A2572_00265 n=1 Tax=Candidatus Collierbacteria bacterium RIFOXYD1_FULL_40_9 TaxID=1817731 RepID=A0A1F5FV59_9BACT|nr:MAG: hypothetical protein A2572_00265 [Candidatus Collierbacteria bacterium RIFOXYD1_FULL_40_9]